VASGTNEGLVSSEMSESLVIEISSEKNQGQGLIEKSNDLVSEENTDALKEVDLRVQVDVLPMTVMRIVPQEMLREKASNLVKRNLPAVGVLHVKSSQKVNKRKNDQFDAILVAEMIVSIMRMVADSHAAKMVVVTNLAATVLSKMERIADAILVTISHVMESLAAAILVMKSLAMENADLHVTLATDLQEKIVILVTAQERIAVAILAIALEKNAATLVT